MGTQWRTAKLVARWHTAEKRGKLNSMPLNGGISGWLVNWGGPDNVIVTFMVHCPLESMRYGLCVGVPSLGPRSFQASFTGPVNRD